MGKKNQQNVNALDKSIQDISEEDLQLVGGGFSNVAPKRDGRVPLSDGSYLDPSPNNPTAGTIYNKSGKPIGFAIGDCSMGPC
jgi:hypothetical protein